MLPKERLLEIIKVQMDLKVESMTQFLKETQPTDPMEQKKVMLMTKAKNQDEMFEKTGVEPETFNLMVSTSELFKDEAFQQICVLAEGKI